MVKMKTNHGLKMRAIGLLIAVAFLINLVASNNIDVQAEQKESPIKLSIVVNTDQNDKKTNLKTVEKGRKKLYIHFTVEDGYPNYYDEDSEEWYAENYIRWTITYPDGENRYDSGNYYMGTATNFAVYYSNKTSGELADLEAGDYSVKFYDGYTDEIIGEVKVTVTNTLEYYWSLLQPTFNQSYGSRYLHNIKNDTLTVSVWENGLFDKAESAWKGDSSALDYWTNTLSEHRELAQTLYDGMAKQSIFNKNCVLKIVSDKNKDVPLAIWTNGKETYNYVSEAKKKADEDAKKKSNYSNEWVDGKWYNADGTQTYSGTLAWKSDTTGWWVEDTAGWYPTNSWQKIDGKWYFFTASGYMDYSEYRDGCWLGSDGAWVEEYYGGHWCSDSKGWWYEDSSGWYPVSQYVWIDGVNYWFGASGYWE